LKIKEEQPVLDGQQAEIEAYRAPLEARAAADSAGEPKSKVRSRRDLLRLAGAAAVGAAGAAALRVVPAAAANGDPITVGGTFTGSGTRTNITNTLGSGFQATGSVGAEGLDGFCSGTNGWGVLGESDIGTGIIGFAYSNGVAHGVGASGTSDNTLGIGVLGTANAAGGLGASFQGGRANLSLVNASLAGPPTSGAHARGDIWMDNWAIMWICIGDGTPGIFAPLQTGGAGTSIFAKVSNLQYHLTNNDGATWVDMDATNLSQIITPIFSCQAVISVSVDLFTANAGYNQDIGIFIGGGVYGSGGTIVAWKESGGSAGTFSPNAAFVETTQPLLKGTTYTINVRWKTNKPATGGATIYAGAGPLPASSAGGGVAGQLSPTRLSTRLIVDIPSPVHLAVPGHAPHAGNDPHAVPPPLPVLANKQR
jgi:hypothetical protein